MSLNICQNCKQRPASYGDGLTWALCSKCNYEKNAESGNKEISEQPSVEGESFEHKTQEGLVSIILPVYLVNYALFHYTGHCIGSIREHTDSSKDPYELIVIDNGSPIKPPSLDSYYADKVVQNETNLGVTKAWNQGIRVSFGEYILLLNNDAQIYDNCLEDMKFALNNGLDLVMAQPMYSNTEPFARATESKEMREALDKMPFESLISDFRDFSCVMFKKELISDIGLFDEQFFCYAQDSDFLKRMEEKGKKFGCFRKVAIHHIIDATGASIQETPEIMNDDKRKYKEKYDNI